MAPLQHHFELLGWNEVTIVIRFWIIAGLFVALGLGPVLRRVGGGRGVTRAARRRSTHARRRLGRPPRASSPGSAVSGFAAADALLERGAGSSRSTAADRRGRHRHRRAGAASSTSSASTSALGPGARDGYAGRQASRPRRHLTGVAPRPAAAPRGGRAAGIPVWGEVELAWRMRAEDGRRAVAHRHRHQRQDHDRRDARRRSCGRPGLRATAAPATSAPRSSRRCCTPQPYDVIAVELSSFQLHWSALARAATRRPASTSPPTTSTGTARSRSTRGPRARSTRAPRSPASTTSQDPRHRAAGQGRRGRRRAAARSASPWASRRCRWWASSTTCSPTAPSSSSARPPPPSWRPSTTSAATRRALAPHHVANALAAAALARAYGVAPLAVRDGLRAFTPDPHRIADVRRRSTASATSTTPRPPTRTRPRRRCTRSSTSSGSPAGCSRGPTVDDLVARRRRTGCAAWCSSAPTALGSPRRWPDTRRMSRSSSRAEHGHWGHGDRRRARPPSSPQPGDVVLLAPAAASMDMFADYGARGDAFAAAVAAAPGPRGSSREQCHRRAPAGADRVARLGGPTAEPGPGSAGWLHAARLAGHHLLRAAQRRPWSSSSSA